MPTATRATAKRSPLRRPTTNQPTQRATVPIVGALLLVIVTVLLAVALSTAVIGGTSTPEPSTTATLDLSVDGSTVTLTHNHGEPLDIEALSMKIAVDGEQLENQPPVPFFSSTGFVSGPTGAFNPSGSTELAVGDSASLTVAGTNSPTINAGSRVTVTLYEERSQLLRVETTV